MKVNYTTVFTANTVDVSRIKPYVDCWLHGGNKTVQIYGWLAVSHARRSVVLSILSVTLTYAIWRHLSLC